MAVSVERGAAIENFVKVFRCSPAEQAEKQLEQLLDSVASLSSPAVSSSKKEYRTPEMREITEEKVREAAGELNRALVRQAEEAMLKVREIAKEKGKLEEDGEKGRAVISSLVRENEVLRREKGDFEEANKELAAGLKKCEGELGDVRTQLLMCKSAVEVASERAGIKVDNRGHKNLLKRVEELVEREKEWLKGKGKKK